MLLTATATFACLDTLGKWLMETYPVAMVVWVRYLMHTLVMIALLGPRLGFGLVRTNALGMQVVRAIVLIASSLMFFWGLSKMPIAECSAISFMSPLLLTILSIWFLKERVPPSAWIAVISGFIGVLLIIRPGGELFTPVVVLPLITAWLFAVYQLLTRKMAGVDPTLTTLFYGALVGTVLMSFFVPFFWQKPESAFHVLLFITTGVLGGLGHFLLISAFERAPASTLAPFIYAQIVFSSGLGYFVFDAFPDGWGLIGILIIVASGVWIALTHRTQREVAIVQADL
ncbi:MAG TPA: DMT family transporter [Burkholderiales bacterium]|nr:DMT family transporter [Burkholderiales bacterium]